MSISRPHVHVFWTMLRWQGIEIHINIRYSFIQPLISFYNSKKKRSAINGVIQSFLLSTVILLCENLWYKRDLKMYFWPLNNFWFSFFISYISIFGEKVLKNVSKKINLTVKTPWHSMGDACSGLRASGTLIGLFCFKLCWNGFRKLWIRLSRHEGVNWHSGLVLLMLTVVVMARCLMMVTLLAVVLLKWSCQCGC